MKYYRVKPEFDNTIRFVYVGKYYRIKDNGILVKNELYTTREREKLAMKDRFFEVVEIPKTKTYWFFGARFAD